MQEAYNFMLEHLLVYTKTCSYTSLDTQTYRIKLETQSKLVEVSLRYLKITLLLTITLPSNYKPVVGGP